VATRFPFFFACMAGSDLFFFKNSDILGGFKIIVQTGKEIQSIVDHGSFFAVAKLRFDYGLDLGDMLTQL
jgi:hypothetical protein